MIEKLRSKAFPHHLEPSLLLVPLDDAEQIAKEYADEVVKIELNKAVERFIDKSYEVAIREDFVARTRSGIEELFAEEIESIKRAEG